MSQILGSRWQGMVLIYFLKTSDTVRFTIKHFIVQLKEAYASSSYLMVIPTKL